MNEELIKQCAAEVAFPDTGELAIRLYHARAVAPLVEVAEALVSMIEHSMTGMVHPEKGRFIKGVTDLDITPDGSVKLSHARAALAPFQQENSND